MQTHTLKTLLPKQNLERMRQATRLQRLAVGTRYDVMIIIQSYSEPRQLFRLL